MDLWSCDTVHSKIHRTPYCDGHRSEVRLSEGFVCQSSSPVSTMFQGSSRFGAFASRVSVVYQLEPTDVSGKNDTRAEKNVLF